MRHCIMTTYNGTISTFQERLVVNVHNCRQQILQNKDRQVTSMNYTLYIIADMPCQHRWHLNIKTNAMYQTEHVTYGKRFARASLCNANHIFATKCERPALGLDRGWFSPVLFVDHIHHIS